MMATSSDRTRRPSCSPSSKDLGVVHHAGGAWHWTSESYPADAISLRSVSSDNFVVVDTTGEPRVIGEVAFTAALTTLHEKAIYLHEGRLFHVDRFDYHERKAYVREVECDYYTDAIDYTQVKILDAMDDRNLGALIASHGEVRINRQIVGFKKLKFYTNENVGAGNLSIPEQEWHTTSFWLHFPAEYLAGLTEFSSDRETERRGRAGERAAHGRRPAADVRPARPGRGRQRHRSGRPKAAPSSRTCFSTTTTRAASDRASRYSGCASLFCAKARELLEELPVRRRLPELRRPAGRVGREGEDHRAQTCLRRSQPGPRSAV